MHRLLLICGPFVFGGILILVASISSAFVQTRNNIAFENIDSRIAYYAASHRLSPLFAIEGTDPELLRTALTSLRQSEKVIAAEYPQNSDVVENRARPWKFLEVLPSLEKERQRLLIQPSRDGANRYHTQLLEAIDLYTIDLATTAKTLSAMDERVIGLWAGTTSVHSIAEQLNIRSKGTTQIRSDEVRRYRCLTTWWYPCRKLSSYYPKPSWPNSFSPEPTAALRAMQNVFGKYLIRDPGSKNASTVGLVESKCLPNTQSWFVVWDMNSHTTGIPTSRFSTLDPLYFFDYSQRKVTGGNVLRDSGVTMEFQAFNPYLCVDYAHDTGTLLAAREIQERIKSAPLFSDCSLSACLKVSEMETALSQSTEFLDSEKVALYIAESSALLTNLQERTLAKYITPTSVHELERRIAIWQGKSARIDRLFGAFDHITPYTAFIAQEGNLPIEMWAVQRGHYSILFQTANKTFGPISTFLSARDPRMILNFPLRTYENDLDTTVSLEELPAFIENSLEKSEAIVRQMVRQRIQTD